MGQKFLEVSRPRGSAFVNESVADQVLNAADSYLVGSNIAVLKLTERSVFRWRLWATKTAAGVAAPTFDIRVGIHGNITDTSRVQLVGPAQTGVVDTAFIEILAFVRSVGPTGRIAALLKLSHDLAATGFAVKGTPVVEALSAAFDNDDSNLHVGLSVNPGAAGVWTVKAVIADLVIT